MMMMMMTKYGSARFPRPKLTKFLSQDQDWTMSMMLKISNKTEQKLKK